MRGLKVGSSERICSPGASTVSTASRGSLLIP